MGTALPHPICSFDWLPPVSHGSQVLNLRLLDTLCSSQTSGGLFAGEEGPEHRNQDQGNYEADEYQTGTCFYIVHESEAAGA